MKIIIAGGRNFNDYKLLSSKLYYYLDNLKTSEVEIISGACKGADLLGENFAKETDTKVKRFPADWDKYGKSAGYKRNVQMAEYADALVAFWDGKSKGTKHMIDLAKKEGLKIRVVDYNK